MDRWIVIGGGISGLGAAELLATRGKNVCISDTRPFSSEQQSLLQELGIAVRVDPDQRPHLAGMTHALISPGISPKSMIATAARESGLIISNEIDLALENYCGQLIAITGTNGKSTTCAMAQHLALSRGLDSALVGNIGLPPSLVAARGGLPPLLVMELSSYQLESARGIQPTVASITSFSYDHIERHGDEDEYFRVKWRLVSAAGDKSLVILPLYIIRQARRLGLAFPKCKLVGIAFGNDEEIHEDFEIFSLPATGEATSTAGRSLVLPMEVRGAHNRLNGLIASLSVNFVCGPEKELEKLGANLRDFTGLSHRCQMVGQINGQAVIDDSKSTNLESTQAALSQFSNPVILLLGGRGKGESFASLSQEKAKLALVITFGESGSRIHDELKDALTCRNFPKLADALAYFAEHPETIVHPLLLSPGCASLDEFRNFEHRGNFFRERLAHLFSAVIG